MLTRVLDAPVPAGWVAADETYGQHSGLRLALGERDMSYVLAVPVSQAVCTLLDGRPVQCRVDAASAAVPACAWQRLSAGASAKGPRLYDWARIPIRLLSVPGRYRLGEPRHPHRLRHEEGRRLSQDLPLGLELGVLP